MKREWAFFVYILASHTGTLYVGMTGDLYGRVLQHKEDENEGFTKRYGCHRLVYYKEYQYVNDAIQREKQIKKYRRGKKECLIEEMNPAWIDLASNWQREELPLK